MGVLVRLLSDLYYCYHIQTRHLIYIVIELSCPEIPKYICWRFTCSYLAGER